MGLDMDISDSKGIELIYMRKQYDIDQYFQELFDNDKDNRDSISRNNFRVFKKDIANLLKEIKLERVEVSYNRKDEIVSNLTILLSKMNNKEKYYYNYTY